MFATLQKGIHSIETKIDQQALSLTGLQTAVDTIKSKQLTTDTRLDTVEERLLALQTKVDAQGGTLKHVQAKAEDLESRSRRNNLRVINLPESFARNTPGNMAAAMEELLLRVFTPEALSRHFVVERAHRITAPSPRPGAPPRPIILKLLNYRDRDTILRLAREQGPLRHEGATFSIYPDFTKETQSRRRAFEDAKQTLRAHGHIYSMLYPARLRLVWQERAMFFETPAAAEDFITSNVGPLQRKPPRPLERRPERHRDRVPRGPGAGRTNGEEALPGGTQDDMPDLENNEGSGILSEQE